MRGTGVYVAALLMCSPLFAQESVLQPAPVPANILGPQLIVWTEAQKPRPVPQPLPPPQPDPPAQTQPQQQQQPVSTATPTQEAPAAQTFTGTIVKDGGKYVLKVSDSTSYQIDDQDKAKEYEGKQVKVSGSLDGKTNLLHITNIELMS